jgi:hypothetical protein
MSQQQPAATTPQQNSILYNNMKQLIANPFSSQLRQHRAQYYEPYNDEAALIRQTAATSNSNPNPRNLN